MKPTESNITQIPVPGGSALTPSGPMQFENDWPGLFIRGDQAINVAYSIRDVLEYFENTPDSSISAQLDTLRAIADVIEKDVLRPPLPKE